MDKKNIFNQPLFIKGLIEKVNGDDVSGVLGECVITSSMVDRDGDVLEANGWDFSWFEKNPVLLWSHNSGFGENRPSIGAVMNINKTGRKITFSPKFDMDDEFARMIYNKYKKGFLNAFSIGFRPTEYEEIETGYKFKKMEALEFSCVNVPANPEALVRLREEKIDVSKSWSDWKKNIVIPKSVKDRIEEEIKEEEKEEEKEIEKGVVPFDATTASPEDRGWDGSAAVQSLRKWASSDASGEQDKIDWNKYKKGFAWFDSENKETFGAYKLPHHEVVNGNLNVVFKGVASAMSALNGARGGVNIPEADISGVYNHLAKHYRQFDREPPERRHYEMAIEKVSMGRKIEKKVEVKVDYRKERRAKIIKKTFYRLLNEL